MDFWHNSFLACFMLPFLLAMYIYVRITVNVLGLPSPVPTNQSAMTTVHICSQYQQQIFDPRNTQHPQK
jgi:hypothetical protein